MSKKQFPEKFAKYSIELLKMLHILTIDGKINQDSNRKLKQIEHLCNFFKPLIESFEDEEMIIADIGAGKSYLGFLLYDLYLKNKESTKVIAIENRKELSENSMKLAQKLNFSRMRFINSNIEDYRINDQTKVDMVMALHACDTATDEAIALGIERNSKFIVVVPCCQAEVARVLKSNRPKFLNSNPLVQLFRHPIHTREFGSHLTNVLRSLYLESQGYQVTVTEFTGLEHSLKNELIIAKKVQKTNNKALNQLEKIIKEFSLEEVAFRFK